MKDIKILHIAPQNFAGIPLDFVKMHRKYGIESRLITIYKNTLQFDEDITLDFTIPKGKLSRKWRDKKALSDTELKFKYIKPQNILENVYFKLRDFSHSKKIENAIIEHDLYNYDIYHFDGGMDFYRDCRFIKKLKKHGKKIVCCYFGSDLRTRGIFKKIEDLSDLNLTIEFDHLKLYKNLKYIYFPFEYTNTFLPKKINDKIKIIHSPTNRLFKGTYKILKVIENLKKTVDFEFILAENMVRNELLKLKAQCDIAIDQVGGEFGGSGYGRNSLENLAIGLPTITEFNDEYHKFLGDNPFINANINELYKILLQLIKDKSILKGYDMKGKKWLEKTHSYEAVNKSLMKIYSENNII